MRFFCFLAAGWFLLPDLLHGGTVSTTITPVSRQVIQRDAANTGDIPISGTYSGTTDRIEARAVVMAGGANNGSTTA
ncbi:MAG TPA: hypothetical protein VF258_11445, partial [Luteolibacter sp.]